MLFEDRKDAGRVLATRLSEYSGRSDVIVLALPRGGVPVGAEVAHILHAPLDVFTVRKLGAPGQEELAIGAIAPGGAQVLNEEVVRALGIPIDVISSIAQREARELERREREYRGTRPAFDVTGKTVILVDDGLATGSSMRVALRALRQMGPAKVIVAVPVGSEVTCDSLRAEADEVVCARTPEPFFAVGQWYRNFDQTTDEEVRSLLDQALVRT